MGPSGSGKSTLLDMLAARKTLGRLTGSVLVNGKPRGPGFRHVSSYVPQARAILQDCCKSAHWGLRLRRARPLPARARSVRLAWGARPCFCLSERPRCRRTKPPENPRQDDNLTPQMNVVETCQLYSALTMPAGTSAAASAARIDEVLAAMGMEHARDRLVGGVLAGGLLLRG